MRTAASDPAAARRAELADFLRARRADLRPADIGIDMLPGRRNTPGLRREELAAAAGVSLAWYVSLEQGRPGDPSPQVIDALARTLRLDDESHRHLRRLAGLPVPEPDQTPETVTPQLARLLTALKPASACLLDLHFDFVAWNDPFDRLWQPGSLPVRRCNLMWLYFAKNTATATVVGREERSRHLLGQFRELAAEHHGDARFDELIGALHHESKQFRAWWPQHHVEQALTSQIAVRRPSLGVIRLDVTELKIAANPSLTICTQVPAGQSDQEKLLMLLADKTVVISGLLTTDTLAVDPPRVPSEGR
jgi:transcriptional regulator with XRE-family HTH domain